MTDHYGSGTWQVLAGKESEFIARWTEFLEWAKSTQGELISAVLLRDRETPGHFVSMAEWKSEEARAAWKQSPEFAQRFGACRALCSEMNGSDYDKVVAI